jgi:hypothetical protein
MKNLSPEHQFEIEASTLNRQQLYDLAKQLWRELADLKQRSLSDEAALNRALKLTDEQQRNWDLIKARIKP